MRRNNSFDEGALRVWLARAVVASVFVANVSCAIAFIVQPERYAPGFELSGLPGQVLIQALGILFLMWNATYPPVVLRPESNKTLFGVILVQQAIGLAGETWIWLRLPPGHDALWRTGLRFMIFDGLGLALMGAAYGLLWTARSQNARAGRAAQESVDTRKPVEP
jgi:hypothetical protein